LFSAEAAEIANTAGRHFEPPRFPGVLSSGDICIMVMKYLSLSLLAAAALAAAPDKQTFTGVITDDMCAQADHSRMQMGPTDAECTLACIDVHGASYVLYDGRESYKLSDQKTPERFAAKKVSVVGTLDKKTNTIQVDSITTAK